MRFSKKASLNLSVNAIVVFVLAFAMLGVGLYVTNLIRESVGGGVMEVVNLQDLKNPPSAEDPITISREVTLKKGKEIKLDIGYYNKNGQMAEGAQLGISECIDPMGSSVPFTGDLNNDLLLVVSPRSNVGASEGKGFKIRIVDNDNGLVTGTYVCTMFAYSQDITSGWGSFDDPYESKQFFLNVVS